MVRVDLEVIRPFVNVTAQVLGYRSRSRSWTISIGSLPVDIRPRFAGLRVHRVHAHVGRDVAVEQIKPEVNQDGRARFAPRSETSPGPICPRGVVQIVNVVGRSVDVTTRVERVGLMPRVVGLGLDCRSIAVSQKQIAARDSDRDPRRSPNLDCASVRSRPGRRPWAGTTEIRRHHPHERLAYCVGPGSAQVQTHGFSGTERGGLDACQKSIGMARDDVSQRDSPAPGLARRPRGLLRLIHQPRPAWRPKIRCDPIRTARPAHFSSGSSRSLPTTIVRFSGRSINPGRDERRQVRSQSHVVPRLVFRVSTEWCRL